MTDLVKTFDSLCADPVWAQHLPVLEYTQCKMLVVNYLDTTDMLDKIQNLDALGVNSVLFCIKPDKFTPQQLQDLVWMGQMGMKNLWWLCAHPDNNHRLTDAWLLIKEFKND